MVVSYTQEHVYLHPWHRVTAAAWRKFTDPAARAAPLSHILDVQTLSRGVDPRAGRLHAVRAIAGRTPPLPFLLRPLAASAGVGDVVLCVERTSVDAPARAMRVVSRNATFRRLVDVEERCSYAPHPERPDEWTLFTQETSIRCAPLAAVSATVAEMVERRCAESFLQNAAKGKEVVERICDGLAAARDAIARDNPVVRAAKIVRF
ncbi:PRELI domain containing protein 3A-like isoform X1 [Hordeum vulgare subsp. vulgare]|uniref:PRELI domain containing protein 3A-like isoform X1 n=1 Tax=Hordeum vulgare subsp. vulgare TaxID=112509 RepID=UPI001D1A3DB8|nr:PRELI domain containing protein 3A-like isoform X1 [Hordeum vulgare subsp. vulgare]